MQEKSCVSEDDLQYFSSISESSSENHEEQISSPVFPKVRVQISLESTVFLLALAVLENHEIFSLVKTIYIRFWRLFI